MGVTPYLFILGFFIYWQHGSFEKEQYERYRQQAQQSAYFIEAHLHQIDDELKFLSTLELFDDMLSNDIDHRITRVLERKAQSTQSIILCAVDSHHSVLAVSTHNQLAALSHDQAIVQGYIPFSYPLYASFDKRYLGQLLGFYPIENLKKLLVNDVQLHYRLSSQEHILLGADSRRQREPITLNTAPINLVLSFTPYSGDIYTFLKQFALFLLITLFVGIGLIYLVGKHLSHSIISPLSQLHDTADTIIKTQDYTLRTHVDAVDEIGSLSHSFNTLLETVEHSLDAIALQSQERMQRLNSLIDMFNAITQCSNPLLCIEQSIITLEKVFDDRIRFSKSRVDNVINLALHVTHFDSTKPTLLGYLVIEKADFQTPEEAKFIRSVAAMITLQLERIELIKAIESASEAKSAFISGMSHELRTPLNAILGYSQFLIAYEELSDDQAQSIGNIEKAAHHLLLMINDILDIAKIEAGKVDVAMQYIPLHASLQECVDIVLPLATEKGLALTLEYTLAPDTQLYADPRYFKQIMLNLLSNAIKFTPKGTVAVQVTTPSTITVVDTGIGIEAHNIDKTFEAFSQLKTSGGDKTRGSGLGLALSRQLAELIGADLTLESAGLGKGSSAVLRFYDERFLMV